VAVVAAVQLKMLFMGVALTAMVVAQGIQVPLSKHLQAQIGQTQLAVAVGVGGNALETTRRQVRMGRAVIELMAIMEREALRRITTARQVEPPEAAEDTVVKQSSSGTSIAIQVY
jgi:hypothetical protein